MLKFSAKHRSHVQFPIECSHSPGVIHFNVHAYTNQFRQSLKQRKQKQKCKQKAAKKEIGSKKRGRLREISTKSNSWVLFQDYFSTADDSTDAYKIELFSVV